VGVALAACPAAADDAFEFLDYTPSAYEAQWAASARAWSP
jgi:hypothetical protein